MTRLQRRLQIRAVHGQRAGLGDAGRRPDVRGAVEHELRRVEPRDRQWLGILGPGSDVLPRAQGLIEADGSGRGRRQPQRRGYRRVDPRLVQELVAGEPGGGHDHDGCGEPRAGPEALRPAAAPPSRRGVLAGARRPPEPARASGWCHHRSMRRLARPGTAPTVHPVRVPAGSPGPASPQGACWPSGARHAEGRLGAAARAQDRLGAAAAGQDRLGPLPEAQAPGAGLRTEDRWAPLPEPRTRWAAAPGRAVSGGAVSGRPGRQRAGVLRAPALRNPGIVGAFQRRPGRLTAGVRGRATSCALVIHNVESSVLFSSGRVDTELSRSRVVDWRRAVTPSLRRARWRRRFGIAA